MKSVQVLKWIDVDGLHSDLIDAAEEGVAAAVQDSVSWIKNDVIMEQKFVGADNFPDVKESTKNAKRRTGATKVLVQTGAYKDSWIGESDGLKGKITGGGMGYAARLHKKWHIDKLWAEKHAKEAIAIIEKSISKKF